MKHETQSVIECSIVELALSKARELDLELRELEMEVQPKSASLLASDAGKPVVALCREISKVATARAALANEVDAFIAPELFSEVELAQVMVVAEARMYLGNIYFRTHEAYFKAKRMFAHFARNNEITEMLGMLALARRLKTACRTIHQLMRDMPALGATEDYWRSIPLSDLKRSRPSGKPETPIEARLARCDADETRLAAAILHASGGQISSIAMALAMATTTNKGRPKATLLSKLDKRLEALQAELRALRAVAPASAQVIARTEGRPGRAPLTHAQQIQSLEQRIVQQQARIAEEVAKLAPEGLLCRRLDALRREHRRYVQEAARATGRDLVDLLLCLLENEAEQERVVADIHEVDPTSSVTAGHKVNPKDSRARLALLERLVRDEGYALTAAQQRVIGAASSPARVLRSR